MGGASHAGWNTAESGYPGQETARKRRFLPPADPGAVHFPGVRGISPANPTYAIQMERMKSLVFAFALLTTAAATPPEIDASVPPHYRGLRKPGAPRGSAADPAPRAVQAASPRGGRRACRYDTRPGRDRPQAAREPGIGRTDRPFPPGFHGKGHYRHRDRPAGRGRKPDHRHRLQPPADGSSASSPNESFTPR